MDSHHEVDVERMSRIIHSCEILLIRFDLVPKRLFIDLRSNENQGPLITLLDPVRSPKERLRQIRALRPEFGDPGGVRILRWPRYVASLERLGVWGQLKDRCRLAGFPDMDRKLDEIYDRLREEERETMKAAIRGDGYNTLWERPR